MLKSPRQQPATPTHSAAFGGSSRTLQRNLGPGVHEADLSCWLWSVGNVHKRKQSYLSNFTRILLSQLTNPYHNKYVLWGLPRRTLRSQLWNNPLKQGRWLSWKNKETSKITAQVWKITIETFSALKNTFQNKPIPGEHVVPQTFLFFSHIIISAPPSQSAHWTAQEEGGRGDTMSFSLLRR